MVQVGVFWVHRDLSYSYREGIEEKLKYTQKQYKMKMLKKVDKVLCLRLRIGDNPIGRA